jgi:hypothetical protein
MFPVAQTEGEPLPFSGTGPGDFEGKSWDSPLESWMKLVIPKGTFTKVEGVVGRAENDRRRRFRSGPVQRCDPPDRCEGAMNQAGIPGPPQGCFLDDA